MFGSILRWISTWNFVVCSQVFNQSGFMMALIGQILTACAQPFLLYSPTKLAAFWFSPKERAFCTMLASLGNPVGLGLAQLISSNVVTETSRLRILVSLVCLCRVISLSLEWGIFSSSPSNQKKPTYSRAHFYIIDGGLFCPCCGDCADDSCGILAEQTSHRSCSQCRKSQHLLPAGGTEGSN